MHINVCWEKAESRATERLEAVQQTKARGNEVGNGKKSWHDHGSAIRQARTSKCDGHTYGTANLADDTHGLCIGGGLRALAGLGDLGGIAVSLGGTLLCVSAGWCTQWER